MRALAILPVLLTCVSTVAAWTTTNHWQTSLITTNPKTPTTRSVAVYPTGAASPYSTNTSTTLFTSVGYTLVLTVFDLFYSPSAAVCTLSRLSCGPPPVYKTTTGSITTTYWAPVPISAPASCTQTSFSYTAASTILLPDVWISDFATQATQSAHAALVTTTIKTISTNLGGQAVTTTVADVYLKADAVFGVTYIAEKTLLTECVNPRVHTCSLLSIASTGGAGIVPGSKTCEPTDLPYPPITAAAVVGGNGGGAGSTGAAGAPGPASSTKSGGAGMTEVSPIVLVAGSLIALLAWI
ncbi:hypothetical protein B0H63DRAFT_471117 [Podospora didyma]|uniref:Secreted protein n=1 Tax=Podospora didyma TaxID=330526 RepID=A0AAE0U272_9PEZI|nr:hypothetical protein B0H63DRAFT_471117 [Podospora didyma]